MSLYGTFQYATELYWANEFGFAPGGPTELVAYQNNIDTVVLYWTLKPTTAAMHSMVWTVETDLVGTFDSPDKRTYVTTDSKINLAGPLVSGNTISVIVDGVPVSATFSGNSSSTLGALAALIAAQPAVASAVVSGNAILVRSLNIEVPAILTTLTIIGGMTQTTGTIDLSVDYIQGRTHKGVAVPVYDRLQGVERTMYWRVKGTRGGADTTFTGSTFSIPMAIDGVSRDAMLALMPDPVYKKDAGSNNYGMHWTYGQSLDGQFVGDVFANNDISTRLVRDVSIQGKFGDMVLITRPQAMKAIDFRRIIAEFYIEARNSPTVYSVVNMVQAALAVDPAITNISDIADLDVNDTTLGAVVSEFWLEDAGYPAITPATVWDNIHLGGGVIVEVSNPLGAIVDRRFMQDILRKITLACCPLYVTGIS